MHERFPQHAPDKPWLEGDVGAALDAEAQPWHDPLYGEGVGYRIGPSRAAFVAVYPAKQLLEYVDPNVILSPRRAARITAVPDAVYADLSCDDYDTAACVSRDGAFTLVSTPRLPLIDATTQEVLDHLEREHERQLAAEWELDRQAAQDIDYAEDHHWQGGKPPTEAPVSGRTKQPRVEFRGTLAADVRCRTTRNGKVVARFPVAVEDEHRTVAAFNRIAEDVCTQAEAGEVKKGDELHVVGYETPSLTPDGREQTVVFAAVVKKPKHERR